MMNNGVTVEGGLDLTWAWDVCTVLLKLLVFLLYLVFFGFYCCSGWYMEWLLYNV